MTDMVAKMHNKNVILICDCIGCKNRPTWRQGFFIRKELAIVDLCEDHHFILRTKVNNDVKLDEHVLKWLLVQDADIIRVTKYGVIDIEFMRELDKIDLDLE